MSRAPDLSACSRLVFSFKDCRLKERMSARLCSVYGRWLAGFRTFEIRSGSGREGFELEALGGRRVTLASKKLRSPVCFNKYGVNLAVLETTAIAALEAGAAAGRVLLFDELGPMATLSESFTGRATGLLFSGLPCVVFYRRGALVFENAFAKMPDTVIIELSPENWAGAVAASENWLDGLVSRMEKIS